MEQMRRAIESNLDRLRPVVGRVFPLEQLRLIIYVVRKVSR